MNNIIEPTQSQNENQNLINHKEDIFPDFEDAKKIVKNAELTYVKNDCYGPPQCLQYAFKIPQIFFVDKNSFDIFFDRAIEVLNQPKHQKLPFHDQKTFEKIMMRARKRLSLLKNYTDKKVKDRKYNKINKSSNKIYDDKPINNVTINLDHQNLSEIHDLFQNISHFSYS